MKITKINLQHLQNAEHFQFHTDALALMTVAPPAAPPPQRSENNS